MITEDYVSFETAKLLKEKGFDECCHLHYHYNESFDEWFATSEYIDSRFKKYYYPCPTLQMAMKWLREKRCIIVLNPTWFTSDGCKKWSFSVWADDNLEIDGEGQDKRIEFDSYEEACEAAIKYCLENLI